MPALKNRQAKSSPQSGVKEAGQANGINSAVSKVNGHQTYNSNNNNDSSTNQASSSSNDMMSQAEEANYHLKKKLIILEEENQPKMGNDRNNNNNNNSNQQQDDTFADTYTSSPAKHQDEEVAVFGRQEVVATSIGQSAKDQFAVALLRLQADLDKASSRLTDIESKLEQTVQQQQKQQQQAASKASKEAAKAASKGPMNNMANILYLTWPVLVFFAMRAIERRSLASKMA